MADKRDEDGFVYHGYRLVRKGGKIKVDNTWYQHEKLEKLAGQTIFIYNTGSYWSTEYSCYPYGLQFRQDCVICMLK